MALVSSVIKPIYERLKLRAGVLGKLIKLIAHRASDIRAPYTALAIFRASEIQSNND